MPSYISLDYQCDVCGEVFEQLIARPAPQSVACTKCPHGTASRVLSPVMGKMIWNPYSSVDTD